MFEKILKKGEDRLAKEEDHATAVLATLDPESDDYRRCLENVERIHALRHKARSLDPNTVFSGCVTLASVGIIILFEQFGGIFTSKAASFVNKPKF